MAKLKLEDVELSKESKAWLTIMAREILDCSTLEQAKECVNTWVTANNLNIASVKTLTNEEFKKAVSRGRK